MTLEQMSAELERLKAENAALHAAKAVTARKGLKISEKGAISMYGLSKFPVTLYATQWESLIARVEEVKAFMNENRSNPAMKQGKGSEV